MMEAAVVVGLGDRALYWHLPPNRSSVFLPDNRDLWEVLWEHRAQLLGLAHSHPGAGLPWPSSEDLTTFAAVEEGLGRRLAWWITSRDRIVAIAWQGPGRLDYAVRSDPDPHRWLSNLREVSYDLDSTTMTLHEEGR